QAFDAAWSEIFAHFATDPIDTERARLQSTDHNVGCEGPRALGDCQATPGYGRRRRGLRPLFQSHMRSSDTPSLLPGYLLESNSELERLMVAWPDAIGSSTSTSRSGRAPSPSLRSRVT